MDDIRKCNLIFKNGSEYGLYVTFHVYNELQGRIDRYVTVPCTVVQTLSFIKREKGFEKKGINKDEIVVLNDEHNLNIIKNIEKTILVENFYVLSSKWEYCFNDTIRDKEDLAEGKDAIYRNTTYNMSKRVQESIGHIKGRGNWKDTKDSEILFSTASKYRVIVEKEDYNRVKEDTEGLDDYLWRFTGYEELIEDWVYNGEIDIEKIIDNMRGTKIKESRFYQEDRSYIRTTLTNDRDLWLREYCIGYKEEGRKRGSLKLLRRYIVGKTNKMDSYIVINKESKKWLKKKLLGETVDDTGLIKGICENELTFAIIEQICKPEILEEYDWSPSKIPIDDEEKTYIGENVTKLIDNIRNNNLFVSNELIKKVRKDKGKWCLVNKRELSVLRVSFNKDMQINDIVLEYVQEPESYFEYVEHKIYFEWEKELECYWV